MNTESDSVKMSELAQRRMLKLCNYFWYLLILAAAIQMAYILVHWEHYVHSRVALVVYLGAPILLIAMSVYILKLVSQSWRLKLSLLVGSVIFSTLLIESYLAFYGNVALNLRVIKARASGVRYDQSSKKQVIKKLRSKGLRAYSTIHPMHLIRRIRRESKMNGFHSILSVDNREVLPLGGIASVATVHNRESGQWLVYESDEYGFRNPAGTWGHDRFDLGVIGDSFAHGSGLPDGKDYTSRLRPYFPSAINLAYGGNGPLIAFMAVREYCTKLKPRFVVYFYYEGNDLGNINKEKLAPLLMRYLEEESFSQNLYERRDAINTTLIDFFEKEFRKNEGYKWLTETLHLKDIFTLNNLRKRCGLNLGNTEEARKLHPDLPLFETILQRMRDETKVYGGTFVFAYLPMWERYKNPGGYYVYRKEVLEILKKNGIPVVDLHPVFQKQADVFSLFHFGLDGHYNQAGARLVADEVRKELESLSQ